MAKVAQGARSRKRVPLAKVAQRARSRKRVAQDGQLNERAIFENALDGMEVIDAQTGRIVLANEAAARIFGFSSPAEMVGIDPLDYVPAKDRERIAAMVAEFMFEKDLHQVMELRALTKDGREMWISATGVRTEHQGGLAGLVSFKDITQQKQAEIKLRASEEEKRLLLDNASVAIVVVQDGMPKFANPKAAEMSGYSPEELTSRAFTDLICPDDCQTVTEAYHDLVAGKKISRGLAFRVATKDGRTLWAGLTAVSFTWEEKPAVWCFINDITERKESERELRVRDSAMASSISAIVILDVEGRVTYANHSFLKLWGFDSEAEVVGKPVQKITSAAQKTKVVDVIGALLQKGDWQGELEGVRSKDGERYTVLVSASLVRDDVGNPICMMASLVDINGRKQAENALEESEKRYRLLAENVSDVIWVTDMSLRPTYVSPSVNRLLGYSAEEAMSLPVEGQLTPISFQAATAAFSRALAPGKEGQARLPEPRPIEVELARKDGSTVWVESTLSFIYDSGGQPTQVMGVLRDITQRKHTEKQLQRSLAKLEETIKGTIKAITLTVEARDPYTAGHQRRVTRLACAIAQEMGLTSERIQVIRIAGLLHDLGKIYLPTDILTKPGQLSEVERSLIKAHPQAAYDILKTIEFAWPIADIVLQHHERINGSGYPLGLREEDILLEARILGVADVLEVITSHRPYRPALGMDKGIKEISHNSGTLYDPDVVNACLRLFSDKGFKFEE